MTPNQCDIMCYWPTDVSIPFAIVTLPAAPTAEGFETALAYHGWPDYSVQNPRALASARIVSPNLSFPVGPGSLSDSFMVYRNGVEKNSRLLAKNVEGSGIIFAVVRSAAF